MESSVCVGASVCVIDGLTIEEDSPAPSVLGSCASSNLDGLGSLPGVVGSSEDEPESSGGSLPEVGFSDNEPETSESSRGKLAGLESSEKSAAIETEKPAIKNARRCII